QLNGQRAIKSSLDDHVIVATQDASVSRRINKLIREFAITAQHTYEDEAIISADDRLSSAL
ncbi:MAG: hypothetical protein AAFQ89_21785, partial [Cyanobacteria bacterium J06626_18]